MSEMEKQITRLETQVGFLVDEIKDIKEWIKCRDSDNADKFAPKWVMTPIIGVASVIVTAVLGALIGLVLVPQAQAIAMIYIKLLT